MTEISDCDNNNRLIGHHVAINGDNNNRLIAITGADNNRAILKLCGP